MKRKEKEHLKADPFVHFFEKAFAFFKNNRRHRSWPARASRSWSSSSCWPFSCSSNLSSAGENKLYAEAFRIRNDADMTVDQKIAKLQEMKFRKGISAAGRLFLAALHYEKGDLAKAEAVLAGNAQQPRRHASTTKSTLLYAQVLAAGGKSHGSRSRAQPHADRQEDRHGQGAHPPAAGQDADQEPAQRGGRRDAEADPVRISQHAQRHGGAEPAGRTQAQRPCRRSRLFRSHIPRQRVTREPSYLQLPAKHGIMRVMQDERGLIEEARSLGGDYYLLKIAAPQIAAAAKPGNFVMVRVSPSLDPLLRRPFGILESRPPYIWLYYQVLGHGTRLLSGPRPRRQPGHPRPAGQLFPGNAGQARSCSSPAAGASSPCSITPRPTASTGRCSCCTAAAARADLHAAGSASRPCRLQGLFIFSEDGSLGQKGLLTDGLEKIVREERPDATLSCGPEAMLAALARMLEAARPGEPCLAGSPDGLRLRRLPRLRGPHRRRLLPQGLRRGARLPPGGDPMADLSVDLGFCTLKNPVITASGTFGYGEEFLPFFDLDILGAIVMKGIFREPRPGNPPPRLHETPAGLLNSIGLAGPGSRKTPGDHPPPARQDQHPDHRQRLRRGRRRIRRGGRDLLGHGRSGHAGTEHLVPQCEERAAPARPRTPAIRPAWSSGVKERDPQAADRQAVAQRRRHRRRGPGRPGCRRRRPLPGQHLPGAGRRPRKAPARVRQRLRRALRAGHQAAGPEAGPGGLPPVPTSRSSAWAGSPAAAMSWNTSWSAPPPSRSARSISASPPPPCASSARSRRKWTRLNIKDLSEIRGKLAV